MQEQEKDLLKYLNRIEERQRLHAGKVEGSQSHTLNDSVERLLASASLTALCETFVRETGCIGFMVNHTLRAQPHNVATLFWWGDGKNINRESINAHLRTQGFAIDPLPFADLVQAVGASYTYGEVEDLFPTRTKTSYDSQLGPAQIRDENAFPIYRDDDCSLILIAEYATPISLDPDQKTRRESERFAEAIQDVLRRLGFFNPGGALSLLSNRPTDGSTGTLIVDSEGGVIYDHVAALMFDKVFRDEDIKCVTMQSQHLRRKVQMLLPRDGGSLKVPPELFPWGLSLEATLTQTEAGISLLQFSVEMGGHPDPIDLSLIENKTGYSVKVPACYSDEVGLPVSSTVASKYTLGQAVDAVILKQGRRFYIVKTHRPRAVVGPVSRRSLKKAITLGPSGYGLVSLGDFQKEFVDHMRSLEAGKLLLLTDRKSIVAVIERSVDGLEAKR